MDCALATWAHRSVPTPHDLVLCADSRKAAVLKQFVPVNYCFGFTPCGRATIHTVLPASKLSRTGLANKTQAYAYRYLKFRPCPTIQWSGPCADNKQGPINMQIIDEVFPTKRLARDERNTTLYRCFS